MFSYNKIITSLTNDNERALLLGMLGFTREDETCINKLGGNTRFLESDLLAQKVLDTLQHYPAYEPLLHSLRESLDIFYERAGWLVCARDLAKLSSLSQSPLVFMARFNKDLLYQSTGVAIVGSRQADEQAMRFTVTLARRLGQHGIKVVSGGAMGIDHMAHKGALDGGGGTIVVAGTVCSFTKPDLHPRIAALGTKNVTILYPYGPHLSQAKYMFVERNRFVVALSDHVVVVQGQRGSGTLHTARFAKTLKIPLYACPGPREHHLSFVTNYLIAKNQAQPLTDGEAFIALVRGASQLSLPKTDLDERVELQQMPLVAKLLKEHGSGTIDELAHWSGMPFLSMQKDLLFLEMEGVLQKKGARYVFIG